MNINKSFAAKIVQRLSKIHYLYMQKQLVIKASGDQKVSINDQIQPLNATYKRISQNQMAGRKTKAYQRLL